MLSQKLPANKELQEAEAALRRAAQTAKKLAEQNGTPYVVAETKSNNELQQVKNESKQ